MPKLKQPYPIQTSDGFVALTPSLLTMSTNHVISWLIGYEPKPGDPFPLDKLFCEKELMEVKSVINHTIKSGQPTTNLKAELLYNDAGEFLCGYSVYPVFNSNRIITGVILCFEKAQKQISLYNLQEHYNLMDELPEGLFTITTSWQISFFNKTAEKITGYKCKEVIGKKCWEVFRSDICKNLCPLHKTLNNARTYINQEIKIFNKDGTRQTILANTSVLKDNFGLISGAVETFIPIQQEIYLLDTVKYHHSFENIIGKSEKMQRLFTMLPDIAESDANVLICGESGTGKDLVAKAIHTHSMRSKGPYVAVNCSAFAESLLESELFGHEKSAFTGADRLKIGRFEMAKAGTLFLDEIGELKPALQVKLLRVLDQREFERVGGTQSVLMEARIISATNKNLPEAIRNKTFREDFYYRLRTVSLTLPPLREKKEDIPLLVTHFIKLLNKKYNKRIRSVDTKVMRFFQQYDFPGNIRELEQMIEHAFVFAKGPVIFLSSLPDFKEFNIAKSEHKITSPKVIFTNKKPDKEAILHALSLSNGNRQKTADLLSVSRTSLWRLIKKLELG